MESPGSNISLEPKLRVYVACVCSCSVYGIGAAWLTPTLMRRMEAYQNRCLRRILCIRSTYASKLDGETPVTNEA
eukprot:11350634-Alexandrium_andersonii.AAC.1